MEPETATALIVYENTWVIPFIAASSGDAGCADDSALDKIRQGAVGLTSQPIARELKQYEAAARLKALPS